MSPSLQDLTTEWEGIKAEVDAAFGEYKALRQKRKSYEVKLIFSASSSPENIADLKQRSEAEAAKLSVNLQQLDQALQVSRMKLKQKRAKLAVKQTQIYRFQAQQQWLKLKSQAENVNQVSEKLQEELQKFIDISEDFIPQVEKWLPEHPKLVEIATETIPYILLEGNKYIIKQKEIEIKTTNFNQP